jgi:CubicO group peptidase (beta-lactamase class C family)
VQISDIARQAQPLIDGGVAPTLAIGVLDGEGTHRFGHGADARTLFELCSITKVFTGVLLADMVRDGSVAFDDAVSRYLPASVAVPSVDGRSITLSDLVTHSSGLPRMPTNFAPADPRDPIADYTADRLYAFLSGHALARRPGARFEYSNVGMMLLGHALAQRMNRSYEALLAERVLEPLGMRDTSLTPGAERRARMAKLYDADGSETPPWTMGLPGAGGLLSTVDDMLRFLSANLARGSTRLASAMGDARALRFAIDPPGPGAVGVGCGWLIGRGGARMHNGGSAGCATFAAVHEEKRHAVVVLCGTFSSKVDDLGVNLMRMLDGEAPAPPRVPVAVPIAPGVLERYVGKYALSSGAVLTVSETKGRLFARRNEEDNLPFLAASETRFFCRVASVELSFGIEEGGKADRVIVHAAEEQAGKRIG